MAALASAVYWINACWMAQGIQGPPLTLVENTSHLPQVFDSDIIWPHQLKPSIDRPSDSQSQTVSIIVTESEARERSENPGPLPTQIAEPETSRPQLDVEYTSALSGYIQTPGWSQGSNYQPNMDSCVTVMAKPDHSIMISLLTFHMPVSNVIGADYRANIVFGNNCSGSVGFQLDFLQFSDVRLFRSNVMSVHFHSGYLTGRGFKLLFSFHNQSAPPEQLSDGLWNCSVPHWADFQQHFLCTIKSECQGREDALFCLSERDPCGYGVEFKKEKCFMYMGNGEGKDLNWLNAREECAQHNMSLPLLETPAQQLALWEFLNAFLFDYVFIGLRVASEDL